MANQGSGHAMQAWDWMGWSCLYVFPFQFYSRKRAAVALEFNDSRRAVEFLTFGNQRAIQNLIRSKFWTDRKGRSKWSQPWLKWCSLCSYQLQCFARNKNRRRQTHENSIWYHVGAHSMRLKLYVRTLWLLRQDIICQKASNIDIISSILVFSLYMVETKRLGGLIRS